VKDWMTGSDAFVSGPIVFPYQTRELIAAANQDGRIYMVDAASVGGGEHRTPLAQSPAFARLPSESGAGGLATWLDADNTRWVFAAFSGPVHPDARFPASSGTITSGGGRAV